MENSHLDGRGEPEKAGQRWAFYFLSSISQRFGFNFTGPDLVRSRRR
jgi:hypothetical protein